MIERAASNPKIEFLFIHEVIVVCSTKFELVIPDNPKIVVLNAQKEFNVSNARNN
jgi:hypothetical protein